MNTNVTMIPVAQLHPHPDNPRKDLGDITELTASIKANGVLQNLTVVPRANPDALGDMDEDTIEAVYGDGIYNDEHDLDTAVLMENAQVNPMKMLMVLLFALTEPVNHRVHDTEWLGGFYKCIKDDASVYPGIYSALDGIGYEISDMEKSLLDGTHPSYESAEEES